MRTALSLIAASALALSGCVSFAPDYQRPAQPVPAAYPDSAAAGTAPLATDLSWQQFFADEALREVIALSLDNNRDLRIAVLKIEQARAQYRIQDADRLPTVEGGASFDRSRTPAALSRDGRSTIASQYGATVGITNYELDLFGRVKSLSDSALQAYFATAETRRSVHIGLVAEVATAWLQWAADLEHLETAKSTLRTQDESYRLTERRVAIGTASNLTLRQQQNSVEVARADVARYTGLVARDRNALALLVGAPVPERLAPRTLTRALNALPPLEAGLPSELMLRRPDVLAAERQLVAANADIGAARAAFFPRITLTGSAGSASRELSGLFDAGSGVWSFMPSLSVPIFDGGRNRANLDAAKVGRDIRVAEYEQAIQSAFREVADALAQRESIAGQLDAQQALVAASDEALTLSDARFTRGLDNYLQVLDAQRTLYSGQQTLIDTRLAELSNSVALYRALGGGWTAPDAVTIAGAP